MTKPLVFLEMARMVVEAVPWGVPWDHSETGIPLSSEARGGLGAPPRPISALWLPVGRRARPVAAVPVVVAAAGGSRETVTPRCL